MKKLRQLLAFCLLTGSASCAFISEEKKADSSMNSTDSLQAYSDSTAVADTPQLSTNAAPADTLTKAFFEGKTIDTKGVRPEDVVAFAQTLKGIPYKYASADPAQGFDCSGFITYVFHHFGILVPRSSIDFTNVGQEVDSSSVRPGDIVLFTGTDSTDTFVGHMGLIVSNDAGPIQFIHATSGKQYGVTVTPLNDYYRSRFVKTIRVFNP